MGSSSTRRGTLSRGTVRDSRVDLMLRFPSLITVPAETRTILRERLARYLPSPRSTSSYPARKATLSDEAMFELLRDLEIEFANDVKIARATYDNARNQANPNEPDFDERLADGWLSVTWGRISTPFGVRQTARKAPTGTSALVVLLDKQYGQTYRLAAGTRHSADISSVAAALERGELALHEIGCRSPEWVAARLWDRQALTCEDHASALRVWVDRWKVLGCPSLLPDRAWEGHAASAFRDAALIIAESEPGLVGWEVMRATLVKQWALASNQPIPDVESFFPRVPRSFVDRVLWFEDHSIERAAWETLEAASDILGPIRMLIGEIEDADHGPAPLPLAARIFTLAAERPALFLDLLLRVRVRPVLLADLLLHPPTAPLACLVIGKWQQFTASAWDRDVTMRDDASSKAIAFADAISVMGHFLRQGSTPVGEAAALLIWLHSSAQPGFVDDLGSRENLLTTFRGELRDQTAVTLRAMVNDLRAPPTPLPGLGTSIFAALLDLIHIGTLAADTEPGPIVDAYVRAVQKGDYTLSAHRIGAGQAATLFALTERSPELRHRFLYPTDVKQRLQQPGEENEFSLADSIARSIRAHIRILCRVVVGWKEPIPNNLLDALIAIVRAGAQTHREKGRIAAFSPRYEQSPFALSLDRPIAADLGAALNRLDDQTRGRLLTTVLETDEPMLLAQLLSYAPRAMRDSIESRIADITPSNAGDIYSFTEVQARIEELLSAEAVDAAAKFMAVEQDLQTRGNVPGRALVRLRAGLRLDYLRGDWTAIANTKPPADLSVPDRDAARDTITFFAALAELRKPDGDWEGAAHAFEQLQSHRRDIVSYAVNLFAARISVLLRGNLFQQLEGEAAHRARQALADAEQGVKDPRSLSSIDFDRFVCNKALIHLALGQPDLTLQLLAPLRAVPLQDSSAAFNAIAFARMGRHHEAKAVLEAAVSSLGETAILEAARAHIANGAAFADSASLATDDDSLRRIKLALFDLLRMDPSRQTQALEPSSDHFVGWVTKHIRAATGSLVTLAPILEKIGVTSEDDLTSLVGALLQGRFEQVGWTVSDQSRGGYTANENPGRRDLVIRKDGAEIGVIEAVICDRPVTHEWTRKELTSHFQKLLGYSTCQLFFHVTYARVEVRSILKQHTIVAEQTAPAGFKFVRDEQIPFTDSRPQGLIAYYTGPAGEVKVVFLVLDMGQHDQKQAGKEAALNNPRRSKAQDSKSTSS